MVKHYSLSRFAASLEKCIEVNFSGNYWVHAETIDVKVHVATGHCYLELIEKEPDGNRIKARMRAVIWASRYSYIKQRIATEAERSFDSGLAILALVKVRFSPQYGLSLEIIDIDPAYTIGEVARRRKELADRLRTEGLIERNKQQPLPHPIKTIALITSDTAAGFGDFKDHLLRNGRSYPFAVVMFSALMQGENAEKSVIAALERIKKSNIPFDVVALVRGGGAELDLSAFDSYEIAKAIALFPLPVLTGIGHQRDTTLCDMVAGKSLKTPTAVADFLVSYREGEYLDLLAQTDRFRKEVKRAMEHHELLLQKSVQSLPMQLVARIHAEKMRLSSACQHFSYVCRSCTAAEHRYLEGSGQRFAQVLRQSIQSEQHHLEAQCLRLTLRLPLYKREREEELKRMNKALCDTLKRERLKRHQALNEVERIIGLMDPLNTLKRGYCIVTKASGEVLKSASDVQEGEVLTIRLSAGSAEAAVLRTTEEKNKKAKKSSSAVE